MDSSDATEKTELLNRGGDDGDGEDATGPAETSFGGDDRQGGNDLLNTSIPVMGGSNPNYVGESSRPSGKIPNPNQDKANVKRSEIWDKKNFFKKVFGLKLDKGDGDSNQILFDNLNVEINNDDKIIGGTFKKVKIFVHEKGGTVKLSKNQSLKKNVDEFNDLLEKAKKEHEKKNSYLVEEQLKEKGLNNVPIDVEVNIIENVKENVEERIDQEIEEETESITSDTSNTSLTRSELREIRGELYIEETKEKLEFLETIERAHWKKLYDTKIVEEQEARAAGNEKEAKKHHQKAMLYDAAVKITELKADKIRLKLNQRPEWKRVLSIIKEEIDNDELTKFEKFKKWAKENLGGISVVAISVADIITTIAIGARGALKKGARATSNFAKGLASLAKKVAPALGTILNIVAKILTLGARGIEFLSRNLWILAIAIAYFLYDKFKNRKREK